MKSTPGPYRAKTAPGAESRFRENNSVLNLSPSKDEFALPSDAAPQVAAPFLLSVRPCSQ